MDERTDVSAAFALRLATDIITVLVITGVLSKEAAGSLVDGGLKSMLASHPEHAPALREIAGMIVTQVGLVKLDAERIQPRSRSNVAKRPKAGRDGGA